VDQRRGNRTIRQQPTRLERGIGQGGKNRDWSLKKKGKLKQKVERETVKVHYVKDRKRKKYRKLPTTPGKEVSIRLRQTWKRRGISKIGKGVYRTGRKTSENT